MMIMRQRLSVLLASLLFILPSPLRAGGWVTGYYPRWAVGDMPPREMTWRGLTHVVHFGAHPVRTPPYLDVLVNPEDSLQLQFGNGWVWPPSTINVQESLIVHAHRNGAKVLLSVGGIWGEEAKTMDFVAQDDTRLAEFVRASTAYARRRGYDGIEIDWEPPSSAKRFSAMVKAFRAELDGWRTRGILAVALANMHQDRYEPRVLNGLVDQMNIMMYDYHMTPAWVTKKDVTYYNAPLGQSSLPTLARNYHYANSGPTSWIEAGFLPSRLGLGIPFYGYCYRGLRRPGEPRGSVWPQYMPYPFVLEALKYGGVRSWDEGAAVPWISGTATRSIGWYVNAGESFFITYDDSASIAAKLRWAAGLGLGGVMIYELWQGWVKDAAPGGKDPLMRAVEAALGMPSRKGVAGITRASTPLQVADGIDITSEGSIVSSIRNPAGIGSRDLEVIRDGVMPESGTGSPAQQFDFYQPAEPRQSDWVGYTFPAPRPISAVLFQEGMHYADGGWLETLEVEVRRSGRWELVPNSTMEPSYADRKGLRAFEQFRIRFAPVRADGVRIRGNIGGTSSFGSVAELRVYSPR